MFSRVHSPGRPIRRTAVIGWAALVLAALSVLAASASPARANGYPMRAELRYDRAISTAGPPDARGDAEVIRAEGEVTLQLRGLPPLAGGTYAFWLLGPGEDVHRLIDFQTVANGPTGIRQIIPESVEIPDRHYERMLITIEDSSNATRPSDRRSLTGLIVRPTAPPVVPRGLPRTGGGSLDGLVLIAAGLVSTGLLARRLGRPAPRSEP